MYVTTSHRIDNKPHEQVLLYFARIDELAPVEVEENRQQVRALGYPALSLRLDVLFAELGHPPPLLSLKSVDLATVRSYGPELALVRVGDGLEVAEKVERDSSKGGDSPLGGMVVALAIYVNVHPGRSYPQFHEWY